MPMTNTDRSSSHSETPTVGPVQQTSPQGTMRPFKYSFWDPEVKPFRTGYLKGILAVAVLEILAMWIVLPVYWGSLAHEYSYPKELKSFYINRDQGQFGQTVQDAVEKQINSGLRRRLGWEVVDPNQFTTQAEFEHLVLQNHAWMVLVATEGATERLTAARQSGDASYNGSTALVAYYSQARNENAAGTFTVPITQALALQAISNFTLTSATQFLQQIGTNAEAMTNVTRAPQTLVEPVGLSMVNLRVFDAPVATALLLVGSIYMIIFSFIITMAGYACRAPLEPWLTTRQLLRLRFIAPLALYIPLSFIFAMVSLAFKAPFGAKFGYAGGFFIYWLYVYMTMCSLGLATEVAVTILTPQFVTFFLLPLIISNVSVATLPIPLMPWFYRYGLAMPVFNMAQATRTIIFDTKNTLGLNAGVLISWIALNFVTLTAVTLFSRRQARRKLQAAGRSSSVTTDGAQVEKGLVEKPSARTLAEDSRSQHTLDGETVLNHAL